jgi:hypothetical protein
MDIDSARFYLRNNGQLTNILVQKTMYNIDVGTTVKDSADLAGKTVESNMVAKLENISTAACGPFAYDPAAYLRVRIIVHSLHASRATAIFPTQRVLDDYSRINYQFGNGVEITKLKSKTGHLILDAVSTLQDTIAFQYALPTAIKNGQSVLIEDRLVPGPTGAQAHVDLELVDYYIDMTLNGDSVNLFPYHLIGDLLYSGVQHTMDLTDSIDVTYGLVGIVPSYIEGYLGETSFNFRDTINFDFFNSIVDGIVELKNPKVTLNLHNSIGVDGELEVHHMQAINHRTHQTVGLTGQLMNGGAEVRGPHLPNVGQSISTEIQLNNSNSNIRDFMSALPDEIQFDMDVHVNKNGNPALRDNFATDKSALSAFLDVEVPLDGYAMNLVLMDTMALNLSDAALPKGIRQGKLKLVVENQFPMAGYAQVLFQDASGTVFDSLFTENNGFAYFPPGNVNQNGYVDVPAQGTLVATFDETRFNAIKQYGKRAIVRFRITTHPLLQHVKIYSTYGIDFHLVGDFNYHVGPSD